MLRGLELDVTEKLIELSVGGDIEAFETLIQSHQKKVYNIALRMTKILMMPRSYHRMHLWALHLSKFHWRF